MGACPFTHIAVVCNDTACLQFVLLWRASRGTVSPHAPQFQPSAHLLPRLQSLLCNEHLAELAGLGRLEQLSLRGCSRLTGAGLAQLGCLRRSLTMLNLSNCTGLTGGPGMLGTAAGAFVMEVWVLVNYCSCSQHPTACGPPAARLPLPPVCWHGDMHAPSEPADQAP